MDISNIVYYCREGDKSRTISLRELCLREGFEIESIFYAVKDAQHPTDLLCRLRALICDPVEFDKETPYYVRFTIVDVTGRTNYLKFNRRKEQKQ